MPEEHVEVKKMQELVLSFCHVESEDKSAYIKEHNTYFNYLSAVCIGQQ